MDGHLGHFQLYLYYRKHCDEHPCTINLYVCDYFLRHVCWSSWHGPAETNLTKNREVEGSIPGLTQWVKDRAFLWAVVSVADVAQIWCSCSSYSSDWTPSLGISICCKCGPKKQKKKRKKKKKTGLLKTTTANKRYLLHRCYRVIFLRLSAHNSNCLSERGATFYFHQQWVRQHIWPEGTS